MTSCLTKSARCLALTSYKFIPTVLRDISGYTLSIKNAHENVSPFTVFGAHLKASNGSYESEQRWKEAKELHKYISQMNSDYHYILAGDFNVYGPGEAHKGRMASVVCHFLDQLKTSSEIKLFDSSHGVGPGEQKRDFVYIDDAIDMTLFMMNKKFKSGIYNIGSGTTSTFNELAEIFLEEKLAKAIKYIPFPKDLILNYQAYTCADMDKLRSIGYNIESTSLASGIKSYINQK